MGSPERNLESTVKGCCTVSISTKRCCLFPTLLRLSSEEVVAIWNVVSAYILGQMKLDKGVLVPGLGTFAVVRKQIDSVEEMYVVRRPVFQLDMDVSCLRELMFPMVMIPGDIEITPLDYWWLSQTTSLPPDVVRNCVQETILLYSFQLRDRRNLTFAFGDIGVLSCQDNFLCMRFHHTCVAGLESWYPWVALLLTRLWVTGAGVNDEVTTAQGMQAAWAHSFPRFRLAISKASSMRQLRAAEKVRVRKGAQECPGKFSQRPGIRQQEPGKKLPASTLSSCLGSTPRMKEAGGQKSSPSARPDTTLLASENCQRVLQEVWQLSTEWERGSSHRRDQKMEWASWEAWATRKDQEVLQVLDAKGALAPHPSFQPRRKGISTRWERTGTPVPMEEMVERFQPGTRHLSPRAIQVLHGLEPHQTRRNIFTFLAEKKRWWQEQQRQLYK